MKNHRSFSLLRQRNIDCQVIPEERKGLTYARICGICQSKGDFVCFLDDDNVPEPDYIAEGIASFSDDSIGSTPTFTYLLRHTSNIAIALAW